MSQGGNTNVAVRRDPATGDTTRVLVHRWCRLDGFRGASRRRRPARPRGFIIAAATQLLGAPWQTAAGQVPPM
jgi:hypothetical protein